MELLFLLLTLRFRSVWKATYTNQFKCLWVFACVRDGEKETLSTTPLASSSTLLK